MKKFYTILSGFLISLMLITPVFATLNTHSIDLESTSSQYLSITDASQTGLDLNSDFTIEAWFQIESAFADEDQRVIAGKFHSGGQIPYDLNLYKPTGVNPEWVLSIGNSDLSATAYLRSTRVAYSTGVWYHVAVSYDVSAGTCAFYLDGVANGTASGGYTTMGNGDGNFHIGKRATTAYWDGLIDDVRVWNDIRTITEISDNYQTQDLSDTTNLVSHWKLNNSLLDETTNNNDLTNNNSAVFSTVVPFAGTSPAIVSRKRIDIIIFE